MLPTVHSITELHSRGPWKTKSGGDLKVIFALPLPDLLSQYFRYDEQELSKIPQDIRGLRLYISTSLQAHMIGGTEFHRIREELVFVLNGKLRWWCDDVYGNKREWILTPQFGIWIHPYILHSYEVMEENSSLMVLANSLFVPDNRETHDTYSSEEFNLLVGSIKVSMNQNFVIKKANSNDAQRVWEIRNSPEARAVSLDKSEIPLEQHLNWFAKKYAPEQKNICFVAESDHHTVGYCRLDWDGQSYIVSIALDPMWHGKGLGTKFLEGSIEKLPKNQVILATVEKGNIASLKLFSKVGFASIGQDTNCVYFQKHT